MDVGHGGGLRSVNSSQHGDGGGRLSSTGPVAHGVDDLCAARASPERPVSLAPNSDVVPVNSLVDDARMECEASLHAPVHGATPAVHGDSSVGIATFMPMASSMDFDGPVFTFHGNSLGMTSNSATSSVPRTGQVAGNLDSNCSPSVRSIVSTKSFAKGPPVVVSGNPAKDVRPPQSVWNRPVVVPLPCKEEFGDAFLKSGRVQLDVDEVLLTVKCFDMALVGRLFGRRFSFDFLNTELHRRWSGFGNFKLVTVTGDCFVCFFDCAASRDAVLMGGPWIVAGQVIGVDYWSPTFSSTSSAGFVMPIWVCFPALPMYCWGGKNIARIAGMLGDPIGMDAATDRLERGHFARVCVRLDLSKPLKPGMWIDGPYGSFFQNTEYEGLSAFCFLCGHDGHKADGCKNNSVDKLQFASPCIDRVDKVIPAKNSVQCSVPVAQSTVDVDKGVMSGPGEPSDAVDLVDTNVLTTPVGFGPWMLVARKKKPPQSRFTPKASSFVIPTNVKKQFPVVKLNSQLNSVYAAGSVLSQREMNFNLDTAAVDKGPIDVPLVNSSTGKLPVSKTFAERELRHLGPFQYGTRNKRRRQGIHYDGGDASPLVP